MRDHVAFQYPFSSYQTDVYWVVYNFMRPHFTTKEVPAVAMGIIGFGSNLLHLYQHNFNHRDTGMTQAGTISIG